MARLNSFVKGIAWQELVPSGLAGMKTLVTAGGGTASPQSTDYVASAAASDGSLLVAYVPPAHGGGITIDMTAMAAPARARWLNPTSGAYIDIGTGLPNTGTRAFTPPGNNGSGFTDWVLVLDIP
jgi:Putative collagen-binding domain of a collagenase